MVRTRLGINLNKSENNINLNKSTNNINLNKPNNINLSEPIQNLRDKDNDPRDFNFWLPKFSEPPGGLVPIGDTGLYRTPDEPADPRDCERYPDSPYCAGNPFSFEFISLEPSIAIDLCNIGIRLDGTLGFIKMPPIGLVYRRPKCRNNDQFEQKTIGKVESIEL